MLSLTCRDGLAVRVRFGLLENEKGRLDEDELNKSHDPDCCLEDPECVDEGEGEGVGVEGGARLAAPEDEDEDDG